MFPLRDNIRPSRMPVVTWLIIALNVLAFAWQVSLGPAAEAWVTQLAVVPARLLSNQSLLQASTLCSSMFLHGDLLHLGGNMWFLWIFGDNVEDRMGRAKYLAFYLVCGVVAAVSQVVMTPTSDVPVIGASGAIAGVLGAYLRLYPQARVLAVVPIFFFLQFIEVPAVVFLVIWFIVQIGNSVLGTEGIAWWAHVAGFVAGVVLSFSARRPGGRRREPDPRLRRRGMR